MKNLEEAHSRLEAIRQAAKARNDPRADASSQFREVLVVDALIPHYLDLVRQNIDRLPKTAVDEISWVLSLRAQTYLSTTHYFTDPQMRAAQVAAKKDIAREFHSRVGKFMRDERREGSALPTELTSFEALAETVMRSFSGDESTKTVE